jgi:hypothetical protein
LKQINADHRGVRPFIPSVERVLQSVGKAMAKILTGPAVALAASSVLAHLEDLAAGKKL